RTWGAAAGRLRHWTATRWRELNSAARELDPEYSPEQPWAEVFAPEERARLEAEKQRRAEEERRQREHELVRLLADVPPTTADDAALGDWLARALPYTGEHQ